VKCDQLSSDTVFVIVFCGLL